jgi:hypothetical protein
MKCSGAHDAYHKFVNTTPKPNATKKRRGELGPLLPPPPLAAADDDAAAVAVALVALVIPRVFACDSRTAAG